MTNAGHTVRILIIDDERAFADSQSRYLTDQGYETTVKYAVESARGYLKSSGAEVNIALVDMYMGRDKEAGLKLVRLMAKHYPWIVSIIVTGHADLENASTCMQAGAFSYIQKGPSPQALITETVKKAVEKFRLRSRLATIRPSVIEIRKVAEEVLQKVHDIEEMLLRITDEVEVESGPGEDASESDGGPVRQADSQ